jgi:adenylosuccinate lyase
MSGCFDHETYLSPLTWRYGSAEMRRIWSEAEKRRLWRLVWVALAEAQHQAGLVAAEELADLKAHREDVDVGRSEEIEAEIRHDLMAELRAYAEQCPVGGRILHLGATSADVEDNADALRLQRALALIRRRLIELLEAFAARISETKSLPCLGYTHLQPAEPTTLGYRLCFYAQDLLADLETLQALRVWGKGIKGAVGTSASYHKLLAGKSTTALELERRVMESLGLEAAPVAGQTYPRKQDWQVLSTLAGVAQSLHKFAFDLRILAAPPFGEWAEPWGRAQVGSSAMPFKKNPVTAEKVCSLARYVAALLRPAWDNAALSLLERTLDDSASRRLILPGAFLALDEMLIAARRLVEGLRINREAIQRNLQAYAPFAGTEALLMALVSAGADRQEMHELIRQHSQAAWDAVARGEPNPMESLLCGDEVITSFLSAEEVRGCLSVEAYLGDAVERCEVFLEKLRANAPDRRGEAGDQCWPNRCGPGASPWVESKR